MMSWFRCLNFNLSKKMIFIKQKINKKTIKPCQVKKKIQQSLKYPYLNYYKPKYKISTYIYCQLLDLNLFYYPLS